MAMKIPDALLAPLNDLISGRLGMHFPKERWIDLERGIAAAVDELGQENAGACAQWLLAAMPSRETMDILARHLSIGETYFFRDRKLFEILELEVMPELIRTRHQLRIWSAGCCTGEEAYSVAMLLDRMGLGHERISILATDINSRFLEKAGRGLYSEWSFRDAPAWARENYFRRTGQGLELNRKTRKMVKFFRLNLAEDTYPDAVDLILCRNVLMYFSQKQAGKAALGLHRACAEGGWLAVSPAEASNSLFGGFTHVDFPGVMLYRKNRPEISFEMPQVGETSGPREPAVVTPEPVPAMERVLEDQVEIDARTLARRCADQGRLIEARRWCEAAIASDRMHPQNYYLQATILREMGEFAAAEKALMKALYIDPDFSLAHFALGNIKLAEGRNVEAERHFSNALSLLRALPRDEIIPESGGVAAGRLVEIVKSAKIGLKRSTGSSK